ncbi:MAG: SH3 domain-containing protein [Lachnospiraceae bacterium]|nr:SH3 domain-containing protein [Lachnospiraceae bacterium]
MRGIGKIIVSICERARIVLCIVALMAGLAVPALLVSAEEEAVTGMATVMADSLNVRSGPGKDYDAIGKLYSGNVVEVVALDGEWLKIKYNDTTGYIALEYAEFEPDEVEEEVVEEEQPAETVEVAEPEEEATEDIAGVSRYKVVFGLIGAIAVLLLIILFTIKSIKKLDEEDDDEDDEDDDGYDDEEEYAEEEEYYEDEDGEEYEEEYEEDGEDDDDDEYEYEYITVRRPKQANVRQTPQKQTSGTDDFLVNIDPKYFE